MQKIKEKVSNCLPNVQSIIDMANSLPFDFTFVDKIEPENEEEQQKQIQYFAKILPDSFVQSQTTVKIILTSKNPLRVVFKSAKEPFNEVGEINPASWVYHIINSAVICRKALLRIVEWNNESRDSRTIQLKKDDIRFFGLEIENGVMKTRAEFPFADLINENTDTRRIKQCGGCKNFFWAKRLNKNVENAICGKCANATRQKRFQAKKDKTETRIQRRKAYYRNKGVKILCENCGRPQLKCGGC